MKLDPFGLTLKVKTKAKPLAGFEIQQGDVLVRLRGMQEASVNCCVTSPPYWGLRDYGTAKWSGGDNPVCKHRVRNDPKIESSTLGGSKVTIGHQCEGFGKQCARCGAVRIDDQIGIEPTPEAYIDKLVKIFREVRRVLCPDGTCWLNLGDSYAGHNAPGWRPGNGTRKEGVSNKNGVGYVKGFKPKDLIGIPWRVAFALQADGWYLRSEIIWSKPNAMPESVTDRPTNMHEHIFLLAKSEKYLYDADAIKEPCGSYNGSSFNVRKTKESVEQTGAKVGNRPRTESLWRNKRDVWTINTQTTSEAHFATFPIALAETCILAGCPSDGLVLDPFAGAGTTGIAALKHWRRFVGIELNPAYIELAKARAIRLFPKLSVQQL